MVDEIRREGYCLLDVVGDYCSSYKGFVSFIVIGFVNKCYLVDCLTLREHVEARMRKLLEDAEIVKFCFRLSKVLD